MELSAASVRCHGSMAGRPKMRSTLKRCPSCGKYTMEKACSVCGGGTVAAHPAKYSPDDKYARYRNPMAYQEGSD